MRPFKELEKAMPPHAREKAIFRAKAIADRLDGPLQHVRQEHTNGCAVASIAMIARLTYREALEQLGPQIEAKVTAERGGLIFLDVFHALCFLGFAVAPEWRGLYGTSRPEWKPEPISDVNIAETTNPNGGHSIVVLRDGTVLDPACDSPRRLDEYNVNWIAGVVLIH